MRRMPINTAEKKPALKIPSITSQELKKKNVDNISKKCTLFIN
jgi:hypothetical protein